MFHLRRLWGWLGRAAGALSLRSCEAGQPVNRRAAGALCLRSPETGLSGCLITEWHMHKKPVSRSILRNAQHQRQRVL